MLLLGWGALAFGRCLRVTRLARHILLCHLALMRLPVPNPQEVEAFRLLYAERFSVQLTPQEALEVASRTLQLFYLKHYPCKPDVFREPDVLRKPDESRPTGCNPIPAL